MAERAHPDDPGFQDRHKTVKLLNLIPVKKKEQNPYRDALFWRYGLVQDVCAGKRVLDVPCGMGWGTSLLKGCLELHGLDIAPEAIDEASRRYGNHADFQVGSMAVLPFKSQSLDLISCLEGIEHVPKDVGLAFLAEAKRVLAPDGQIIVSSPHCNDAPHSGNPYHVYEYPPNEMHQLLSSFFKVEDVVSRVVDNLTISVFYARKVFD